MGISEFFYSFRGRDILLPFFFGGRLALRGVRIWEGKICVEFLGDFPARMIFDFLEGDFFALFQGPPSIVQILVY